MEEARIQAETREERGKGPARRLRRLHRIPAVVYGRDVSPVAVSISSKDWRVLAAHVRSNAIIRMELNEAGAVQERPVMVKHVQKKPVERCGAAYRFSASVDGKGGPGGSPDPFGWHPGRRPKRRRRGAALAGGDAREPARPDP